MASLNKVMLIGHLGRDPETRTFPSGDAVCNITIATTESWKDKQTGEKKEATEWHRIMFAGKLAEIADQYLRKGSQVYVEGKITTRKWTDKDGIERFTTEIRADQMRMLGAAPGDGQRGGDGGRGGNDQRGGYEQRGGQQERGGYEQRGQAPAPQQQRAAPPANAYQPRNPPQARAPAQAPAPAAQGGGYAPGSSGFEDMSDDIPF